MDIEALHLIPSSPKNADVDIMLKDTDKSTSSTPEPTKPKTVKVSRRPCNLPLETVEYLKAWMMSPEHIAHPYPTEKEKQQIMADTGIELKQLTNWFVNNRKRYWKPLVEAKLQKQQQKDPEITLPTTSSDSSQLRSELITYPTSAKALFSIVPKIPITNFSQLNHNNFGTPIARNVSQTSLNNLVANAIENAPAKIDLDVFQLAVNYLLHSFTSLVSDENNSLNDEDEDSAATGASISSITEAALFKSQQIVDFCPSGEHRKVSISEEYSEDDSLTKRKRAEEMTEYPHKKMAKTENTSKWREACANALHSNDISLPSLDEATELFGFTS